MSRIATISVGFLLVACASEPRPEVSRDPPILVRGAREWVQSQRTTRAVPGSDGRLRITIDDITAGQVMVTITSADGSPLIGPVSMLAGGGLECGSGAARCRLVLLRLHNNLIGEDYVRFRIEGGPPTGLARDEVATIERLLALVRGMEDSTFLWNGVACTGDEAADVLCQRWNQNAESTITAEDFIRLATSRSSASGKPFIVRRPDGREIDLADLLTLELACLRSR